MKFDIEEAAAAITVRVVGDTKESMDIIISTPGWFQEMTLHYAEVRTLLRMLRTVQDIRAEAILGEDTPS